MDSPAAPSTLTSAALSSALRTQMDNNHPRPADPTNMNRPMTPPPPPQIHDILIIGAGPAGLAVAARLCEQTPAALFTDEEHRRYHWIRKSAPANKILQSAAAHAARPGTALPTPPSSPGSSGTGTPQDHKDPGQTLGAYKTLILDATGPSFLSRWDANFQKLCIPHLRSPLFFHIDPLDRDGLLAFAHERGRYEGECIEISGVVGKELSKHARKKRAKSGGGGGGAEVRIDERDRKDYLTPSTGLFRAHCDEVISRYGLRETDLIQRGEVRDVQYAPCADWFGDRHECAHEDIFCVTLAAAAADEPVYARVVVVAAGPAMARPRVLRYPGRVACHSSQIGSVFPAAQVGERIKRGKYTAVCIVGGGLTSAQLADLAIKRGVSKVYLLMRGELKVKPFDVDLAWMGKFRNREKAAFWSADEDQERLDMIKTARNGGSIPAPYVKLLKGHQAKGRLEILTHTTLKDIVHEQPSGDGRVEVVTEPRMDGLRVDYVYFATGPGGLQALDASAGAAAGSHHGGVRERRASDAADQAMTPPSEVPVPFLQSLQASHPIPWLNGLPALTDDLAWCGSCGSRKGDFCGVPLFITGALAALRLGPGAPNLEGARIGAERVVWGIHDVLPRGGRGQEDLTDVDEPRNAYLDGRGGRYEGLADLDASE